jgi:peptide/nickel transport system substrate-binding protein
MRIELNRRDLLRATSTATIVGGFSSLVPFGSAWAQSRQETLLVVSENGPNNLDVQGVGTNRPGYEVS